MWFRKIIERNPFLKLCKNTNCVFIINKNGFLTYLVPINVDRRCVGYGMYPESFMQW